MEQQYKGPVTDRRIRELFADAGDFNYRTVEICGFPVHTYAIDGLTSGGDISDFVIRPLLENLQGNSMQELYQRALQTVVYNSVADVCPDLDTAARKLVNGFCVVLFEGTGAIAFEDKTEEKRSPSRPEVENTVKGPKDAFTETIRTNTSLIRRHLRTPELQLYETVVGRRSLTNVAIVSIRGLTSKELVRRLKQRLAEIDIDGMVSPASVEEYVTGSRATPFPLIQYTERTDKFCQGLLDGRVGLLVDGLPQGYLLPVNIGYLMQTPEDRGVDYISGTCVRCIRYLALLISLLLPAVYVAMTMFHPEMIPDADAARGELGYVKIENDKYSLVPDKNMKFSEIFGLDIQTMIPDNASLDIGGYKAVVSVIQGSDPQALNVSIADADLVLTLEQTGNSSEVTRIVSRGADVTPDSKIVLDESPDRKRLASFRERSAILRTLVQRRQSHRHAARQTL